MSYKILIIEDNEQNLYLTKFLLESYGHVILSALSGLEGIKLAESSQPDFILLDIQLPEVNGYEILEKCKKSKLLFSTPIIVVTSYAMAGDRERCMAAGANGYIEKPINPDTFMQQIEEFLLN